MKSNNVKKSNQENNVSSKDKMELFDRLKKSKIKNIRHRRSGTYRYRLVKLEPSEETLITKQLLEIQNNEKSKTKRSKVLNTLFYTLLGAIIITGIIGIIAIIVIIIRMFI